MLQLLINAAIYAAEIAVIATGLALTFSILRFANFAHVQFAIVGGYFSYAFAAMGLWLPFAILLSAIVVGFGAIGIHRLVFRPLADLAPEGKMIVSWGVALVLRSTIAAVFGGASLFFEVQPQYYVVGDAIISSLDIAVIVTAIVAMIVLHIVLFRTTLGTALRALADNRDLAETRGMKSERLVAVMWFIAGAFAALGGTLFALQARLQPDMDLLILLPVFASVTLFGLGSIYGAVAGAVILSFAQNIAIGVDLGGLFGDVSWFLPTQFRDAIAVGAMMLVLVLRPRAGISGAR
ncbi:branched-chain amino acid ABC transporter permease [Acuticoccus kandeliae]|uniref:branched-chain amino acid ABC transporter permease n=1 Tax=Acuticoccus kandeliae TaxID=2073160 RepID=UPI000D3E1E17|nr:branched-chain amino acid ABC transporter permease [Acuticoccus kandeliae]